MATHPSMIRRWLFCALGAIACAACSHQRFEYTPRGAEAEKLAKTEAQFVAAVNADSPTKEQRPLPLDLDGRLALLELLQKVVVENASDGGPSRGLLKTAALLLMGGEFGSPFTQMELEGSGWQVLQDAITERLDLGPVEKALIGAVLGRRGAPTIDEHALRDELHRRLDDADVATCEVKGPRVSYSADLLAHVDGPDTRRFREWKDRAQSAHLVTLTCEDTRGLLLLTREKGNDEPRIAAWQFFTEEQWAALAPRLDEIWGR